MANQITGRIIEIGQTVQIPSKNGGSSFTKREFILDATTYDPYTGERSEYENVIPLELQNRCAWWCIAIPTNNIGTTASATVDLSATATEFPASG